MEETGRRTSKRARRPPPRLDNGGDEHSVQQVQRVANRYWSMKRACYACVGASILYNKHASLAALHLKRSHFACHSIVLVLGLPLLEHLFATTPKHPQLRNELKDNTPVRQNTLRMPWQSSLPVALSICVALSSSQVSLEQVLSYLHLG